MASFRAILGDEQVMGSLGNTLLPTVAITTTKGSGSRRASRRAPRRRCTCPAATPTG
ncbi:hypothetical protein ACFQX6_39400 [Streptosporangium lutulentum]